MKNYSSHLLKITSIYLMVFPLSHLIFPILLFDINFKDSINILTNEFYILTSLCSMICGYGLYHARRWSWYTFIVIQPFIFYINLAIFLNQAESHHKYLIFIFLCLFQLFIFYQIYREIQVPYYFPKIKWWESNPRYRFSAPVKIRKDHKEYIEGEILDVSPEGCFVKTHQDFKEDEELLLHFKIFQFDFECKAFVVWNAQSSVTHPKGIGLKFLFLEKDQKRSLRVIKKKLRKISSHYRKNRYLMTPQEFLMVLEEIETSSLEKKRLKLNLMNDIKVTTHDPIVKD